MATTTSDNAEGRPGYPPTREDMFWVDAMRRVLFDSMSGMHNAAVIITSLSGIGLLGYLGWLLSPWGAVGESELFRRLIVLLPAVLWAVAGFYGSLVFLVRKYRYFANSPDSARLAFRRISRKKAKYLYRAFVFWFAGILAVMIVVIIL